MKSSCLPEILKTSCTELCTDDWVLVPRQLNCEAYEFHQIIETLANSSSQKSDEVDLSSTEDA